MDGGRERIRRTEKAVFALLKMKRDYEKNENDEISENIFVYFVIFVFFVIPL